MVSERGAWWNDLSLDVAVGALVGLAWAGRICDIHLPPALWVIVPAATFSVYTLDHLLDARTLGERATSSRHRLHVREFRLLASLAAVAATLSVVLAFLSLRPVEILGGFLLGVACLLHQFGVRRLPDHWPKELFVATIYVVSLWWIPLVESGGIQSRYAAAMIAHLAAALVNLLSFALLERERDRQDGFPSAVLQGGERLVRRRAAWVAFAGMLAALMAGGIVLWILPLILIAWLLPWLQKQARPGRVWHRWVGDVAFLWLAVALLLP